MKVDCTHWIDCATSGGGCCAIKEYKRPSFGVCLTVCGKNTAPLTQQEKEKLLSVSKEKSANEKTKKAKKECVGCKAKGLKRLIRGGAGLLKAELGIDACNPDTILERRRVCESCEHYDFGLCTECGCILAAKVKLKSENCPLEKWNWSENNDN